MITNTFFLSSITLIIRVDGRGPATCHSGVNHLEISRLCLSYSYILLWAWKPKMSESMSDQEHDGQEKSLICKAAPSAKGRVFLVDLWLVLCSRGVPKKSAYPRHSFHLLLKLSRESLGWMIKVEISRMRSPK